MKGNDKIAVMDKLPNCDLCNSQAKYDGKTKSGPWAYMCEPCFKIHGVGLGLGKGQELILKVKIQLPEGGLSGHV